MLAHHARERIDRRSAPGRSDVGQDPQAVGDQGTARRRRRIGQERVASELRPHRPPADDAILGEVALGQHAAVAAHMRRHGPPELAAVQGPGAVVAKCLERPRQVRLNEPIAGREPRPLVLVDRP